MGRKKNEEKPRRYMLAEVALLKHPTRVAVKDIVKYRQEHNGISFDEIFSLPLAFATFIVPRLELFRDETDGIKYDPGMTSREDLDAMIRGFRKLLDHYETKGGEYSQDEEVIRALELFTNNMFNLWF